MLFGVFSFLLLSSVKLNLPCFLNTKRQSILEHFPPLLGWSIGARVSLGSFLYTPPFMEVKTSPSVPGAVFMSLNLHSDAFSYVETATDGCLGDPTAAKHLVYKHFNSRKSLRRSHRWL